jgi:hypothetical protein
MSSQERIAEQLTKDVTFRIILPVSVPDEIDIDNLKSRDWLVPGEKALVLIETSSSLAPLEAFSIYCTVTDSEHTPHSEYEANELPLSSVSLSCGLRSISPFRLPDNRMIFPFRIQVPCQPSRSFDISTFCHRNPQSAAARLTCSCLQPFSVRWNQYFLPQSLLLSFEVRCQGPDGWGSPFPILDTSLKFDESISNESELRSSICIVRTNDSECSLDNRDIFNFGFSLKPQNDRGATYLSNLRLLFTITWKAWDNIYQSIYRPTLENKCCDLVISCRMIECEHLKASVIPLRLTNIEGHCRHLRFHIGSGPIQPMMKQFDITFSEGEESQIYEFGFIPLCIGEHQLELWSEEGDHQLRPMFPICLSVKRSLSE